MYKFTDSLKQGFIFRNGQPIYNNGTANGKSKSSRNKKKQNDGETDSAELRRDLIRKEYESITEDL